MTLVVPDDNGSYLAHPWPTWSNLFSNGGGESWNVENAVPLKSIFFLKQALKDQILPIGIARSACLINESSRQSSWIMPGFSEKQVLRKLQLDRFGNVCKLSHTVPSHILNISPKGSFWEVIERSLNG
jgi:SynChlorMet cassette protein ScmC